ncbi:hypothetical protein I79_000108 [Cricetulus griseus]|uniref:Uncharacterized protein n=1 Tax=Cricetulus griseus TaxID=10029 RepID=G3GRG2_CRIGR|nr:hypothetical protein I79_000108 [Cricetulus griseus]
MSLGYHLYVWKVSISHSIRKVCPNLQEMPLVGSVTFPRYRGKPKLLFWLNSGHLFLHLAVILMAFNLRM